MSETEAETAALAAAERVLAHLRHLAAELTSDERSVLSMLLAPGIAAVYQRDADVSGFGVVEWAPDGLAKGLVEAVRIRRRGLPRA